MQFVWRAMWICKQNVGICIILSVFGSGPPKGSKHVLSVKLVIWSRFTFIAKNAMVVWSKFVFFRFQKHWRMINGRSVDLANKIVYEKLITINKYWMYLLFFNWEEMFKTSFFFLLFLNIQAWSKTLDSKIKMNYFIILLATLPTLAIAYCGPNCTVCHSSQG